MEDRFSLRSGAAGWAGTDIEEAEVLSRTNQRASNTFFQHKAEVHFVKHILLSKSANTLSKKCV